MIGDPTAAEAEARGNTPPAAGVLLAELSAELHAERAGRSIAGGSVGPLGEGLRELVRGLCPPQAELKPGQRLHRFELRERVGRGGFGEVWSAWDVELHRLTALKLVALADGDRAGFERVRREIRASAAIRHPHVVAIRGAGVFEEAGIAYIEMELSGEEATDGRFVVAQTSRAWVAEARPSPRRAAEVVRDAALGLREAHALGVLHGDVSPGNLLVSWSGPVQLTDFGLARAAGAGGGGGFGGGTPAYLSPEAATGSPVRASSDVFGLGGVLSFLLDGKDPFEREPREGLEQFIERVARQDGERRLPPGVPPGVPPALRRIHDRMRAADASLRYESASCVVADLEAFLGHRPPPGVGPGGAVERLRAWLLREDRLRPAGLLAAACFATAAVFHAGTFLLVAHDGLMGRFWFGRYGADALSMRGILVMTACFTGLSSLGAWLGLRSRDGRLAAGVGLLSVLGFYLCWVVAVLLRLFAFDAGGLLADPAALNTMYSFWLTLLLVMTLFVGLGVVSAWLRRGGM